MQPIYYAPYMHICDKPMTRNHRAIASLLKYTYFNVILKTVSVPHPRSPYWGGTLGAHPTSII